VFSTGGHPYDSHHVSFDPQYIDGIIYAFNILLTGLLARVSDREHGGFVARQQCHASILKVG
jgi:hypothetical protein